MPDRQAVKLPDAGTTVNTDPKQRLRRAMMATIATSANGALGNPSVTKPTLG